LRGPTYIAVLADEAAFWMDASYSSNPDTEILNAVRPGLATTSGPISCSPFQAAGVNILRFSVKLFGAAAIGQGRRHDRETTVDHALMRGLVTAGPVMRRGVSSV